MNKVKQKLQNGEVTIGTWMQIPSTEVAEILSQSGLFDWVCLDVQHGSFGIQYLGDIFATIRAAGVVPLIRGRWDYGKMLDLGAGGIIAPEVDGHHDAELVVGESNYPPDGYRSFGFSRVNKWGKDFDEYTKTANDNKLVVCQIESKYVFEEGELEDMLTTDGMDATMIGPYDLSGSLGIPGDLENAQVKKLVDRYLSECKSFNKPAGTHVVKPDPVALEKAIDDGYKFIAYGTDAQFLMKGCKDLWRIHNR